MDERKINYNMMERDANRTERRGLYELCKTSGKEDAELLFGAHKGECVSDLVETPDGKNYLVWLMQEDFPEELQDIIKMWWDDYVLVEDEY